MPSLYVGAYWGDRAEDLNACAERLLGYVRATGEVSELLETWVSRRRAPVPGLGPESTLDDARALLTAGINRKDFGGEIMPELGFSAGLWNGRRSDEAAASLTATCGLAAGSPHLSNASVLRFPARFGYDRNAAAIDAVLDAAIRWWKPDWAWFGSDHIRDGQDGLTPSIGLLTYLARHRYVVNPRAADIDGVGIERLPSGVLLRCAPDAVNDAVRPLRDAIHERGRSGQGPS
jgi:hypothetical protein